MTAYRDDLSPARDILLACAISAATWLGVFYAVAPAVFEAMQMEVTAR